MIIECKSLDGYTSSNGPWKEMFFYVRVAGWDLCIPWGDSPSSISPSNYLHLSLILTACLIMFLISTTHFVIVLFCNLASCILHVHFFPYCFDTKCFLFFLLVMSFLRGRSYLARCLPV